MILVSSAPDCQLPTMTPRPPPTCLSVCLLGLQILLFFFFPQALLAATFTTHSIPQILSQEHYHRVTLSLPLKVATIVVFFKKKNYIPWKFCRV
jgi:hypothetical protein